MPTHQETRLLPYSAAQMFDLVASIERYPEFLPWCKESKVISRTDTEIVAELETVTPPRLEGIDRVLRQLPGLSSAHAGRCDQAEERMGA